MAVKFFALKFWFHFFRILNRRCEGRLLMRTLCSDVKARCFSPCKCIWFFLRNFKIEAFARIADILIRTWYDCDCILPLDRIQRKRKKITAQFALKQNSLSMNTEGVFARISRISRIFILEYYVILLTNLFIC